MQNQRTFLQAFDLLYYQHSIVNLFKLFQSIPANIFLSVFPIQNIIKFFINSVKYCTFNDEEISSVHFFFFVKIIEVILIIIKLTHQISCCL